MRKFDHGGREEKALHVGALLTPSIFCLEGRVEYDAR